jgi:hypothetical protein
MMPLPDWEHPVYTLDDEAFRAHEQPKPRYIWQGDEPQRPAGVSLTEWDAPFGGNVYEAGQVRGE